MLALAALTQALILTEPASLAAMEGRGFAFKNLVGSTAYDDFTQVVSDDMDELARQRQAARASGYDGDVETMQAAWLRAPDFRFELIGAVPRLDRRAQRPGTCGEARLIYRAVLGGARLPMTSAVVYSLPTRQGQCAHWVDALAWPDAPTPKLVSSALARPGSPWRQIATHAMRPMRVELNLQTARWPYTNDSKFSDQVHYLLRVLRWRAERLVPIELENTPDVSRLKGDPALRQDLLAWLKAPTQSAALAAGTLQVPTRFLATKAVSISPFGLSRLANRPFSAVFAGDLPLTTLRALDVLSCTGCHQSRAIAGFHLLGFERGTQPAWTSLKTPWSAHFAAIQSWRAADQAALVAGQSASPQPDPERFGLEHKAGAPCGAPDGPFAAWTCDAGYTCRQDLPLDGRPELGTCHPDRPARGGDACDPATLTSAADSLQDIWNEGTRVKCADGGVCATSRNGFPAGLCARTCTTGDGDDKQPCVAVPTLGPFTICLKAGGTFAACAAQNHALARLPACDATADCRPDFVCVNGKGNNGACVPTYFLHQLTIEHRKQ
jgi:hypothetical protein